MRRSSRKVTSASWPFWLLLLAWFCANSPPLATYAVLTWLSEARSFSHQQRIKADVARLLAGEDKPSSLARFQETQVPPSKPAIPTADVLKKSELAFEETADAVAPPARPNIFVARTDRWKSLSRAQPPQEPPRAAVLS
jgi:hypothetical protein